MNKRLRPTRAVPEHWECCRVTKLEDGRCRAILPTRGEINIIGGTLYQKNHGHKAKLADGIVFWSPDDVSYVAAAIELKSGRVDVTVATGQLQNGAALAEDLSRGISHVKFSPILVTRQLHVVELKMIKRATVIFRGQRHEIVRTRCGDDLTTIMSQQRTPPKR